MDKYEVSRILIKEIMKELAFDWASGRKLEDAILRGLDEVVRRRQVAGPEVMEMRGGAVYDLVLCQGDPG